MNFLKNPDKFVAPAVASLSLLIYILTLSPTVNFWDSGEFIACADTLQINHPPGNPTYLLLARMFSMCAILPQQTAWLVNLFSAVAAAFTVFFTCKVIFSLSISFCKKISAKGFALSEKEIRLISHFASATGALALAFSLSFWAIATETEVYSLSALFTAMMVWMMTKHIDAEDSDKNRWLILLGLILGLSTGVHLLNILIIPALGLMYYFHHYNFSYKGFGFAILISIGLLAFVQIFISGFPVVASWPEWLFVNQFGAPFYSGLIVFAILIFILLVLAIYFSGVKAKRILNLIITSVAVFIIGYSTFAIIIIRSASNPPHDQNNTENIYNFISYLNREQYGERPLWKGQQFSSPINKVTPYTEGFAIYDTLAGKYKVVAHKPVAKYEKGSLRILPRMWSKDPLHILAYPEWTKANQNNIPKVSQNFAFMFRYQFSHMYLRYFMWNFAGRQNDIQSHGGPVAGNWISGIGFIDNIRLSHQENKPLFLQNNNGTTYYFLIPLLLGIIGIIYQFKADKKNLFVTILIFIFTGIAIAFYLNQTPYQVRERDYSFIGSLYAFALWIGLGTIGLYLFLRKYVNKKWLVYGTGIICLVAVPGQFLVKNYKSQDKSENDFAYHFALNMLNSCDANAILFVSGDNETFPLWYLQECEHIRTDVRIINLSFLNNDWYIDQIQHPGQNSKGIKLSVTKNNYISGKCEVLPVVNNTAAHYDYIYKIKHKEIQEEFLNIHEEFCDLLRKSGYATRNKAEFDSFDEYFKNIKPFGNSKDFINYCSLVANLEDDEVIRSYGISPSNALGLLEKLRAFLAVEKNYVTNADICLNFMLTEDTAFMIKTGLYNYPVNYCPTREFVWPVNKKEVMKNFEKIGLRQDIVVDNMRWKLDVSRKSLNKSDLMVLEIIRSNNWQNPIYFSSVMNSDNYLGLDRYLYLEGLAFRLIPVETEVTADDPVNINSATMYANIINQFKWGSLSYNDENIRNMLIVLRTHYSKLARGLFLAGANKQLEQVLRNCIKLIPNDLLPFEYSSIGLVHGYYRLGKKKEAGLLSIVIADNAFKEVNYYNSFPPEISKNLIPYNLRAQKSVEELIYLAEQYKNEDFLQELNKIYKKVVK